jgi:hypothetical protein
MSFGVPPRVHLRRVKDKKVGGTKTGGGGGGDSLAERICVAGRPGLCGASAPTSTNVITTKAIATRMVGRKATAPLKSVSV